jgi:hypothetical protein
VDHLVGNTLVNFVILGWTLAELHEWFMGQRALVIVLFVVGGLFVLLIF